MGEKIKNSILFKEINNEAIIRGILYFIILVLPFIVLPVSKPVYTNSRSMFLYPAAILLLIIVIKDKKIKLYKESILAVIFLFTLLIAAIFSDYKYEAFWGNYHRDEGFFTIAIYILLFIVSSTYFKINKTMWNIMLIAPTLMSIYGIMQFFGIDPIQKFALGDILMPTTMGTIGHRNFFSTYILIFIAIYLSYYIFNGGKKYLFCTTLMFSALLCSTTRSGWVAFGVMALIGFIFIIRRKQCLNRAIIVFILFTSIFLSLNYISSGAITNRALMIINEGKTVATSVVSDDVEIEDSFGSSRIFIWKMAYNAFIDSPFWGQGPDTLRLRLMDDYYEKYMSYAGPTNDYFDKAHNEFLEYAASGGIFTVISYISVLILILFGLFKNIKDDKFKILFIVVFTYIIQSIFNISVIIVAPIVWILLWCALKAYKKGITSIIDI